MFPAFNRPVLNMKKRIAALLSLAVFWMAFFFFARLFFIITHYHNASAESMSGLLATFLHGSLLDISVTGYFLLLPFLIIIPGLYFYGKWQQKLISWYSYMLIALTSIIIVADATLYSYWGFRMDYTPLFYLKTPGEAIASVSTFKLVILLSAVIIIASLFIFIYRKYVGPRFGRFERTRYLIPGILVFLVLTGTLIIPIRGGTGIAPVNAGSVYFSDRMFLNHTAINAVWNVGTTAFTQKPVSNPYQFMAKEKAAELVDSLYVNKEGIPLHVLNTGRPNILLIVLESFSGYFTCLDGDSLTTPNLNRYAKEGILFSDFYASGTRTDKAMPAILSGYPAQPAQSIIKEPKKTQSLPGLVRILMENSYRSSFWYGGDINFANFRSYIISSGFKKIVTENDFSSKDYNSKWGVHDHIMFKALKDFMKKPEEPFCDVVLTLSSHEPFDVPMKPVFKGNDYETAYRNSVFYADSVLGDFLDWSRSREWWKNTLIILVADHGGRYSEEIPASARKVFRIPMIWTGGALSVNNLTINKFGGQTDIPLTLLNQMGIRAALPFSKDLLSESSHSFAFYTFNEGFGFLNDSSAVEYDQKYGGPVVRDGKHPGDAETTGKAYLQVLFDDYLKR